MSKNIEIEYKTMLTEEEFFYLMEHFQISAESFIIQTNLYFDTKDFRLKSLGMGLRIRYFKTRAEATLKVPQAKGLLEITDDVPLSEVDLAKRSESFTHFAEKVLSYLAEQEIYIKDLRLIGDLVTKRAELTIEAGKLALDENWYTDHHDFELELEVQETGKRFDDFLSLLNQLAISYRPAKNKIVRAISARKHIEKEDLQ
ncbi:CYTH domain-containing protein [Enterococcus florum]|uniref:CYTH domain-containing protein n=1 Tax=Enterococcus florum TaxID=2480627 RepID=A0A4P5P7T8_9ENTE|nr:CYTH domain-containing protein [Enterococcus florum]GCF94027.1 CYTH domain-containing protein [Enterococcus florum]